jgi:hypothetical protein
LQSLRISASGTYTSRIFPGYTQSEDITRDRLIIRGVLTKALCGPPGVTGAEIVQLVVACVLVPVGVVLVIAGGVVSGVVSLALATWLFARTYRSYQERDPGAF